MLCYKGGAITTSPHVTLRRCSACRGLWINKAHRNATFFFCLIRRPRPWDLKRHPQPRQVTSKTQALHATCETLLAEQKRLEAQVIALSAPLQRFGALEELGPALGLPFVAAGSRREGGPGAPRRSSLEERVGGGGADDGARWGGGAGVVRRVSSGGGGGSGGAGGSGGRGSGRVLLHPGSDEFAEVRLL